jgi:aspartate aminotransferase/N-succinyldiaminopimelate aminotransferase
MTALRANAPLDGVPLSVFDSIVAQLRRTETSRVIPLHQGKTAFTVPVSLRDWEPNEFDYPPHLDGPSAGTQTLLSAIRDKLESQLGEEIDPARIQVTAGITHALAIVFHAILEPGDEVLLLSPQWLFAAGLVRAAQGVPVEVPFFPVGPREPLADVAERIAAYVTPRTRAIYFNTPNNPTGASLSAAALEELVAVANDHGLWLISDNAYEYYDYSADGFVDPAGLAAARERTFSAYSFSKSFGLTGYRIGYLLSPPSLAEMARKLALYSIYSVATCCQFVALSALRSGGETIARHRAFVADALKLVATRLEVPVRRPDGGFYAFLDLSGWPGGASDFVSRCIAGGVSLAPGHAFGRNYEDCARLCYSVVDHDDLAEGIRIVNDVWLTRGGSR